MICHLSNHLNQKNDYAASPRQQTNYVVMAALDTMITSTSQPHVPKTRFPRLFLSYLLLYLLSNIYFDFDFDLISKTRCNLLFRLIGHSGLLKDVNISFFLS